VPIQLSIGQPVKPVSPAEQRELRRRHRFWSVTAVIVTLIAFITILRMYAFEFTVITSASMDPTIKVGDYALFDKRVALSGHWNRGDVVIFKAPPSWDQGGAEGGHSAGSFKGELLCKRIIGMPGEKLSIEGGVVYINGQVLPNQTYIKEAPVPEMAPDLPLGPNQYFMMGDNRNNSNDSRDNGPISEGDIQGRVLRRLWPLSRAGALPATNYEGLATDN